MRQTANKLFNIQNKTEMIKAYIKISRSKDNEIKKRTRPYANVYPLKGGGT